MEFIWLVVAITVSLMVATLHYSVIDFARRMEKTVPLPQIDCLEEKVDDYIEEHYKEPQRYSDNLDARADWTQAYNDLEEDIATRKLIEKLPYGSTVEGDILSVIRALESRYGFDHPRTQQAVKFHERKMGNWKQAALNWDRKRNEMQ